MGPVYGFDTKGDVFVGGGYGLYRSTNNGDTWKQLRVQPTVGTDPVITCLSITNYGDIFFASSGSALWRSTDNGDTWFEAGINSDPTVYPSFVTCSPQGVLFAATQSALYRSTNRGNSIWETVSGAFGSSISFAFNNASGEMIGGGTAGLFRSMDNGDSWTPLSPPGMGNLTFYSLAIAGNDNVFEGTQSLLGNVKGISRSTDSGTDWTDISTGLTSNLIHAFAISWPGYVFAATDSGVFRYYQPTGSVKTISGNLPSSFELGESYPNPFSSITTVRFSIPEVANVSLRFFDLTGREVVRRGGLMDQTYDPGSYEITFDGKGLPSGMYFYRFSARLASAGGRGGLAQTRTFVLLP
jgi:photosystem II stability/assembly factor-like uncharacterized protein